MSTARFNPGKVSKFMLEAVSFGVDGLTSVILFIPGILLIIAYKFVVIISIGMRNQKKVSDLLPTLFGGGLVNLMISSPTAYTLYDLGLKPDSTIAASVILGSYAIAPALIV